MKKHLILTIIVLCSATSIYSQHDKPGFGITFSGFVKTDMHAHQHSHRFDETRRHAFEIIKTYPKLTLPELTDIANTLRSLHRDAFALMRVA